MDLKLLSRIKFTQNITGDQNIYVVKDPNASKLIFIQNEVYPIIARIIVVHCYMEIN